MPHLAALAAPRRLTVVDGVTAQGRKLQERYLKEAFAFTAGIFKLSKAEGNLAIIEGIRIEDLAARL